jgi:choline-sulfatase
VRLKTIVRATLGLAILGGLGAGGWRACSRLTRQTGPPDVYLVTIDTLRADAVSLYARGRRTPAFEDLAEYGEVFERAVTPMPMTRPAHFSIFTGLYPREHGVINNSTALPMREEVLAEIMERYGYATAAFVSASPLGRGSGAHQGFEVFEDTGRRPQRRARDTVEIARAYLQKTPPDEPVFVWVHMFDPHQPYDPPASYRHGLDPLLGGNYPRMGWQVFDRIAAANGGAIPGDILGHAIDLYRREAEYDDEWLGHLMDAIDEYRDFDNALVIVTADHGECFEKGIYFEHSDCLYEGAIHVPLVIKWPKNRVVGRSRKLVSLVDITPTVLSELSIPVRQPLSGRAIQELGDAPRDLLLQHPYFASVRGTFRTRVIREVGGDPVAPLVVKKEKLGIMNAEWKYIRTGSQVQELYRLSPAPDESTNLADRKPEVVETLSSALDGALAVHPFRVVAPQRIDEDLRKALEVLGYLRDD